MGSWWQPHPALGPHIYSYWLIFSKITAITVLSPGRASMDLLLTWSRIHWLLVVRGDFQGLVLKTLRLLYCLDDSLGEAAGLA